VVDLQVRTSHGEGHCAGPLLQTWEIAALAKWLEALAAGGDGRDERLFFDEPNLEFQVLYRAEQEVTIWVRFVLEQPGACDMDNEPAPARSYTGDLTLRQKPAALRRAVESLRQDVRQFPVRSGQS
jgi:hypothetical protein